jgi:hypothetical protein
MDYVLKKKKKKNFTLHPPLYIYISPYFLLLLTFGFKKLFLPIYFFNASTTFHFTYCFLFWLTIVIFLVVFYLDFCFFFFLGGGELCFLWGKRGEQLAKKRKIKVIPQNRGALKISVCSRLSIGALILGRHVLKVLLNTLECDIQ